MRNLKLVARSLLRFAGDEDPLPLSAAAWDAASNAIICAFGPSASRAVIELKRLHCDHNRAEERLASIAEWDALCPLPSLPHDSILNLHHFADSSTTCLVLKGGDIILVREDPQDGQELVESVGCVETGIAAAAWSPDEELLVIVTEEGTLSLMSRDIDEITRTTLSPDDVNISTHVSVGWGKKETQFKGKRARALQDPTVPETVDQGVLSPLDDGSVTVSWRGDGAYFAVNTVEQQRRRMIRVFSREGTLDSVSEPVDGLEGALSWRPSGNLIASIRRSTDQIEVIFFERNGLRHGQFALRCAPEELLDMKAPLALRWNGDSSVLAVCSTDRVQLWTMSNYHYDLKQEVVFPEMYGSVLHCTWHPERPLLTAVSNLDALQVLEYASTVACGSAAPPNDFGLVAAVDGLSLRITPLRIANIPPPMSLHKLALTRKVVDVAFSMSSTRVAILSHSDIAVYQIDLVKRPVPLPVVLWRNDAPPGACPRSVTFLGDDQVCILTDEWDDGLSHVWISRSNGVSSNSPILDVGGVSSILSSVNFSRLYAHFQNGRVCELSIDQTSSDAILHTSWDCTLPSFAPEVKIAQWNESTIVFGLTKSGSLFANERTIVRNCTSYAVTPLYLIFTTTQNHLKFVHMSAPDTLEIPPDEPQLDERCRSIERGSKIVTVIPTTYSVVLQMPRGNLETIYPRALVLAAVRESIRAERYDEAFLTCRNQRVDMNILHDHDPDGFLRNISKIVSQIRKPEHIDLLLSQLRDEDVSETMYKETSPTKVFAARSQAHATSTGSKVNRICDAFLSVLGQAQNKEYHLQNLITAHVCKQPADLVSGLELVGRLQADQDPLTERAAEHICFLADVNQLYETSLGIYNLELALLIAQQSQKDPREYLPHLQSLYDVPLLRRKFNIDNQLGRRAKALGHLKEMDAFDEVQSYVQAHDLYKEALNLYQYDVARHAVIMRLYASYLSHNNRHREAALAFEFLNDHAAAWPSYRSANMWREALASATLAGVSSADLKLLATSLMETLTESKDYVSAATITFDYLGELPEAIRLLCKDSHFAEATRMIALHNSPSLLESIVDPVLIERSAEMTEFLAEMKNQLLAQAPRLAELRTKKLENPMAFYEGGEDANIPDNISLAPTETTSGGTFMTRYTNRTGTVNTQTTRKTSKNKRREERKRARGKKGTVYEEEYLINSIERLIERINSTQDEIKRLVEGLVKRGMVARADAVEKAASDVVSRCEEAVKEVYSVQAQTVQSQGAVNDSAQAEGVLPPRGADATLLDSLTETSKVREAPLVKSFERLSLLG